MLWYRNWVSRGLGCSVFRGLICGQTARCRTLKFRSERKVEDQQDCECTGNCGEYQVPVRQGLLRECSFQVVNQGVYVERFLRCCKTIFLGVKFIDHCCECLFDTGELVSR